MSEYLAQHWFLSIIATIILGAIGSGLWDIIFKPYGQKVSGYLFTLITFGAKRAKDKVYKKASMGHHEYASLYILLLIFMFMASLLVISQVTLYKAVNNQESYSSIISECSEIKAEEQKECVKKIKYEKLLTSLQLTSLLSIFVVVSLILQFSTVNRINLLITHYNQCIKIIRPFLSDNDFYFIEQKFSLITCKEDYEELFININQVARKHDTTLPLL